MDRSVEWRLNGCASVLKQFGATADAFVINFFVDNHWQNIVLPCWRSAIDRMSPSDLASWLDPDTDNLCGLSNALPLSMLALRAAVRLLALPRMPSDVVPKLLALLGVDRQSPQARAANENFDNAQADDASGNRLQKKRALRNKFRRHVKPKKQHEICRLASVVELAAASSSSSDTTRLLDVGAGHGHLARLMAMERGFRVTALDSSQLAADRASAFDKHVQEKSKVFSRCPENMSLTPKHVTLHLDEFTSPVDVEDIMDTAWKEEDVGSTDTHYGIMGLHSCGDLGPWMCRTFCESPRATFLVSVECCYMKMRTKSMLPLSDLVHSFPAEVVPSEVARELACHAIETFCTRLREDKGHRLKVHCNRAVLECVLAQRSSELRGCGLRSTGPNSHEMTFEDYARTATANLELHWTEEELHTPQVVSMLSQWWRVVAFYSLRLAMAPIIETFVLLDRVQYLREHGFVADVMPVFDPITSPRNFVIVAKKSTLGSCEAPL